MNIREVGFLGKYIVDRHNLTAFPIDEETPVQDVDAFEAFLFTMSDIEEIEGEINRLKDLVSRLEARLKAAQMNPFSHTNCILKRK